MAIKGASSQQSGERIEWDELAKEEAAVVITNRGTREVKTENGVVDAVKARVIVLSGSLTGTVYDDALILKGGIRGKCGDQGDDTVGRVGTYEHNGRKGLIGLNDEQEGDLEKAEKALAAADKKEPVGVSGKGSSAAGSADDPDF